MSTRVTTTVVCCILMQILCVVSQKSFSFWGTSSPNPLPGLRPRTPLGDFVPQAPSLLLCPPNNPVRSTPMPETSYESKVFWYANISTTWKTTAKPVVDAVNQFSSVLVLSFKCRHISGTLLPRANQHGVEYFHCSISWGPVFPQQINLPLI